MELRDAIELIRFDVGKTPAKWADLGCGGGLFSRALAHLLVPGSTVFAIDRTAPAFDFSGDEKGIELKKQTADFIDDEWGFSPLDGILMANSFHYVKEKASFIHKLTAYLKPDGRLLFVEYDTDVSNAWVPYPVRVEGLRLLLAKSGFSFNQKLHERPSAYGRAKLYSLLAKK